MAEKKPKNVVTTTDKPVKAKTSKAKNEEPLDGMSEEQIEKARVELRKSMREKFGDYMSVEDTNASDEDIEQARKDFEEQLAKYQNQNYNIGSCEEGVALRTAQFLKDFNENYNSWANGSWRGIIRFDKFINEKIKELEADDKKNFEIDYQTLIFLYQAMGRPNGLGLASARAMAKMENYNEETDKPYDEISPVTYSGILEKVIKYVNDLKDIDKMLNLYKERIAITAAGIKFTFTAKSVEEFKKLHEIWVTDNIPNDPKELEKIDKSM